MILDCMATCSPVGLRYHDLPHFADIWRALSQTTVSLKRLNGKSAIVTGASRGIGRAVAVALAAEGASVLAVARNKIAIKETQAAAEAVGGRCLPLVLDVTKDGAAERAVGEAVQIFGGVDILINNAGIDAGSTVRDTDQDTFHGVMRTNLDATFLFCQAVIPHMEKKGGSIINIASISGKQGSRGLAAYCASKFAVVGLSQSLFEEVRELGIKVCCLCPGYVNTSMPSSEGDLDPAKMIQAEDIADCILWVVTGAATMCPVEIVLRPQRAPYRKRG